MAKRRNKDPKQKTLAEAMDDSMKRDRETRALKRAAKAKAEERALANDPDRVPLGKAMKDAKASKEKKPKRSLTAKEEKRVTAAVAAAEAKRADDAPALEGDMLLVSLLSNADETQARVALSEETVAEYADSISEGAVLPPIEVMTDGTHYWITDGWHRKAAAEELNLRRIKVRLTEGTLEDAIFAAVASNRTHGLRRTNRDKVKAVQMALTIDKCRAMSDRELAEHVGVSHEFVRQQRAASDGTGGAGAGDGGDGGDGTPPDDIDASMAAAEKGISEALDSITKARQRVAALVASDDGEGSFINENSVDSDLQNAENGLRCALPGGRCVYCKGEKCKACAMLGWLGRQAMANAPESIKGGAEGAAERVKDKRRARAAAAAPKEDDAPQPIGKDRGKRIGPKSKARPPAKAADDKGGDEVPF